MTPKYTTENVYLCYKNSEDKEEFTPICDVLEFGAPADETEDLELMNDHLYIFSELLGRFVILD
jgi:hypothetical protein